MARRENSDYDKVLPITRGPTFANLVSWIQKDMDLKAAYRRDLASNVRRAGSIIGHGRPLEEVPAHPELIRRRFAATTPAAHGLSQKTWQNITSGLNRSLELYGVTRASFRVPLQGRWLQLQQAIRASDDMSLGTGLSRFPRYCQQEHIQPEAVTSETFLAYRDFLAREGILGNPHMSAYHAARSWNRARHRIEGWPDIEVQVPSRSRRYALPWTSFPPTLKTDVDNWLARTATDDIFDLDAPPSPISTSTRKRLKGSIHRFASALVLDGTDPAELRTLADLVEIERVKRGLRVIMDRLGGKPTGGLGNFARALKQVARWHVKVPPEQLAQLTKLTMRLSPQQRGMVAKNRARLEPFKNRETVFQLLTLPERIIDDLSRVKCQKRRAARFETALAIMVLCYCPVRFGNLRSIEIDRHIVRHRTGRKGHRTLLVFPDSEVKNRREITLLLPPAIESMIDLFVSEHRPHLIEVPSRYLFSKRSDDAPIGALTLSKRITDAIRADLGRTMTPHNFRHLAGLVYLQVNPDGFHAVSRLLGHANSSTATQAYTGLETDAAHEAFTRLLDTIRRADDG